MASPSPEFDLVTSALSLAHRKSIALPLFHSLDRKHFTCNDTRGMGKAILEQTER